MKFTHRVNKVAELKSSFDYGRTYTQKDNKQRVKVSGLTKYSIKKYGANFSYNVTLSHIPAVSHVSETVKSLT
jgi:hypothetical protein